MIRLSRARSASLRNSASRKALASAVSLLPRTRASRWVRSARRMRLVPSNAAAGSVASSKSPAATNAPNEPAPRRSTAAAEQGIVLVAHPAEQQQGTNREHHSNQAFQCGSEARTAEVIAREQALDQLGLDGYPAFQVSQRGFERIPQPRRAGSDQHDPIAKDFAVDLAAQHPVGWYRGYARVCGVTEPDVTRGVGRNGSAADVQHASAARLRAQADPVGTRGHANDFDAEARQQHGPTHATVGILRMTPSVSGGTVTSPVPLAAYA